MKDGLTLRKEGLYWTLYLGEESLGCGYLEDIAEEIIEEFNDFR